MSEENLVCAVTIRAEDRPIIITTMEAWKVEQACSFVCDTPESRGHLGRIAKAYGATKLIARIKGAEDVARAHNLDMAAVIQLAVDGADAELALAKPARRKARK